MEFNVFCLRTTIKQMRTGETEKMATTPKKMKGTPPGTGCEKMKWFYLSHAYFKCNANRHNWMVCTRTRHIFFSLDLLLLLLFYYTHTHKHNHSLTCTRHIKLCKCVEDFKFAFPFLSHPFAWIEMHDVCMCVCVVQCRALLILTV